MNITVLGAGSWGTTLAHLMSRKHSVSLWARSSILLASSFEAKPPKTTECMAPILAQASIATTASGIIGI